MPRTKAPKKRKFSNNTVNETVNVDQTKKKTLREKISEIEDDFKSAAACLKNSLDNDILQIEEIFSQIRLEVLNGNIGHKTLSELRNASEIDDNHSLVSSSSKGSSSVKSAATAFIKPRVPRPLRKRSNSCATRSSSKKSSHASNARSASADRCNQLLKTPDNRCTPIAPVTPKVNPDDPVSVLRRPNQGEFALSLFGSPLYVTNVAKDDMPSVTVPMPNGNVVSILPTEGIHSANLDLDDNTCRLLRQLKSNIDKCLQMQG